MYRMKLLLLSVLISCSFIAVAQRPGTISREDFSLQFPADWTIDTDDPDYNPDSLFSLDAPDDASMIMFIIIDMEIDEEEMTKNQVEAFSNLVKDAKITRFDTWGRYKGTGTMLSGLIMGHYKGNVRIFVRSTGERTLLVVQQFYDVNYDELKKGFELIERSFKFK